MRNRIGDRINPVPDAVSFAVPSDTAVAAGARSLPPRRGRRPSFAPYALILPVAAAVVLLLGYPIYKLFRISFERYGLFELIQKKGHWIGVDNYRSVLGDHVFWDTVVRTVIFTIVNVGLTIVLGTLIALLLPKISRWVRILLTTGLVFVWAMPVVVAVQVFYWMTNFENGVLNYLAAEIHLVGSNHDWYATPTSSLGMVTLLIVWGALPFIVISVYAGLAQVPHELTEAARVDGAGAVRIFRDVTFPVLKPILLILTSLSIIWDFGVFAQPYLLIGSSHIDSTNYLMGVYVFIKGYADHNFGLGATISLLMLLMVAVLSISYVRQMVKAGNVK